MSEALGKTKTTNHDFVRVRASSSYSGNACLSIQVVSNPSKPSLSQLLDSRSLNWLNLHFALSTTI